MGEPKRPVSKLSEELKVRKPVPQLTEEEIHKLRQQIRQELLEEGYSEAEIDEMEDTFL